MIHLSQHVPGYVNDGQGGFAVHAPTLEALLKLPEVAVYAEDTEPVERYGTVTAWVNGERREVRVIHDAPEERRFHRFSRSDDLLMVEHDGGDYYWVVGRISADDPRELDALPTWQETEAGRQRREAWNRGEIGKQSSYRCAEHGVDRAACCLKQ